MNNYTPTDKQVEELLAEILSLESMVDTLKQSVKDKKPLGRIAWNAFYVMDKASSIQYTASRLHEQIKQGIKNSLESTQVSE